MKTLCKQENAHREVGKPAPYSSILVCYNAFFALSQGTVVSVYLSELFLLA